MENYRSVINRLNTKIVYLENEIKMLKDKHHAEIQEWQRACSILEDEILEMQDAAREVACPELLEDLEDRLSQTQCGCEHPACRRCRDDSRTREVIAKAKGEQA